MVATILLFDIDGTLVTTGGAGRRSIERAFAQRHGRADVLSFSFGGMTDRAIVRDGLFVLSPELVGAALEAEIDATLAVYLPVLAEEVATGGAVRVHPGVTEVLDRAAARNGVAIGLGTGNVVEGARIKLACVNLFHRFAFGGFGSDHVDRAALLRIGAERGAARLARPIDECRVVVIGDTPKDIAAARAIGAESIAVATGFIAAEELQKHEPTHVFESLAVDRVADVILGL